MRKLKLQVQVSLDGYIADGYGKTDWLLWNWGNDWVWDNALQKDFTDLTATVDCILLSGKMAREGFIGHWEKMAKNQASPQSAFAKKIAAAHKVVFTKTLGRPEWENTSINRGDLAEEINRLKNQEGRDILVYGGASFVSALIKARLIDEFHLFINPTILGKGMGIFSETGDLLTLSLVKAKSYACGIIVLVYMQKN